MLLAAAGVARSLRPAMALRAASYARFSSDMQREDSIADQQRRCREWAQRESLEVSTDLEFVDEAVSGTRLERNGLNALLIAAESARFEVLLVYSLSRLARESVITMPMLKKLVHVHGIRVVSLSEGIDSQHPGWEMLATMLSLQAEQYIKDLSASVFRGQEGIVLSGRCVGDYCFGYRSEPIEEQPTRQRRAKPHRRYVIDPETAPWVVRIFTWFAIEGHSVRWIIRELNRLGAPKDHRSTSRTWFHQLVIGILKNPKYVGVWPWGVRRNKRNPLDGTIRQEQRAPQEQEKYVRSFENLRLIPDELRERALQRLAANAQSQENRRGPDGRLRGSQDGNGRRNPKHLLAGMVRCGQCQATFHVCGARCHYLCCPNYACGTCSVKTQLPRLLAEKRLLELLEQRLLADSDWQEAVFQATLTAWKTQQAQQPEQEHQLDSRIAEVERRIQRLLDLLEDGGAVEELKERLAERRRERDELLRRRVQLRATSTQRTSVPTREWVQEQLRALHGILTQGCPAAARALRLLIPEGIRAEEIQHADRQRHHFRLQFRFAIPELRAGSTGADGGAPATAIAWTEMMEIAIQTPSQAEEVAKQVMDLWHAGRTYKEIAQQLGIGRALVTSAVACWHRQQGLTPPDGRAVRLRLNRKTRIDELAEPAKALLDEGLLMQEIALRLHCGRDQVTKAIQKWYQERGLPPPDGRTRRKQLAHKPRKSLEPKGTCDGEKKYSA